MADSRPNVLLIVLHGLGTHLGCYGNPTVRSPNVDRLAGQGVRFSRNFATATYCSPSRGAIITGRWPHSNGLMGLVNLGWTLPRENRTLVRQLGESGYETHLFGLQHEVADTADLGFDRVPEVASARCEDVAGAVESFLQSRAAVPDASPFYARVGFIEVHRIGADFGGYVGRENRPPFDPQAVDVPGYLVDTSGARQDLAEFHACVEHADASVGRIIDALDATVLAENTVVVVTTDHGIDFPRAKGTLYDAGINTAMVMRWPRGFSGGREISRLVSNIDLMPTILEAAGAEVPVDVQGESFLPLLRGDNGPGNSRVFAEKNTSPGDAKRCIRTDRWKYIRNFDEGPELLLGTCSEYSLTRRDMSDEHLRPRPEEELYDLAKDPRELRNLAGLPEHRERQDALAAELSAWMEETADPLLRGSVSRPDAEEDLIRQAWESMRERARGKS